MKRLLHDQPLSILASIVARAADPFTNTIRIMKMSDITPKQERFLAFIHAYTTCFGFPPSETEMAKAIGASPTSVSQTLKALETKQRIRRQPGVARTTEILAPAQAIPEWQGERLTSAPRGGTLSKALAYRPDPGQGPKAIKNSAIYCFKITLEGLAPDIWRRIETKDLRLEKLHLAIKNAMGWSNVDDHLFEVKGVLYAHPKQYTYEIETQNYQRVFISDLFVKHGANLRMCYVYDLREEWEHEVLLEAVMEPEPSVDYPRCTAGARACPLEDLGNMYEYAAFLDATNQGRLQEYKCFDWLIANFDPAAFDPAKATRRMRQKLLRV